MGENLYEVSTTVEKLHVLAGSPNEASSKARKFLSENYASGMEDVNKVNLLSETRKFKSNIQLIV